MKYTHKNKKIRPWHNGFSWDKQKNLVWKNVEAGDDIQFSFIQIKTYIIQVYAPSADKAELIEAF